jgi:hypothetical protein
MQKSFERLFVELMQETLPSVHLYVDPIASAKKRAASTPWRWIVSQNEEKMYERPFNEDDVQWVVENIHHLRPASCPPIIVNKKHGDKMPDYRFELSGSPTFEVKGPVKCTFFNPERFGHNWTKPLDVKGGQHSERYPEDSWRGQRAASLSKCR